MKATIKVGTELEIGTVVEILNDGVLLSKAGNTYKVDFSTIEREIKNVKA